MLPIKKPAQLSITFKKIQHYLFLRVLTRMSLFVDFKSFCFLKRVINQMLDYLDLLVFISLFLGASNFSFGVDEPLELV